MVNPLVALGVFWSLVLGLALVFWPRRGLWPRIARLVRATERALLEDALKHVHDCEYQRRPCTVPSVAGVLEVTRQRATRLVARLEALRLVEFRGPELVLTSRGRDEARRVLRSHRLWERYLADRTGTAPADWHDEAERLEHTLPPVEVERLAAGMGHPVYDPHGDPIPTPDGDLPPRVGHPVTSLAPGQAATVLHLEDEPRAVYEELVASGLAPGLALRLLDATPDLVRLEIEGEELALAPVAARNITVAGPADAALSTAAHETLADLAAGETGVVLDLAPQCHGPQRRRLLDLGLVPGTKVTAELTSAIAGPVAYRVRGALIGLRPEQARTVRIDRVAGRRAAS